MGNRPDQGLGFSRMMASGNRVDPGGGPVLGTGRAIDLGLLLGQGGDHGGDRPVFEAGWRLDVGRQERDDPADLAVLLDDALAVTATAEMAVELGPLGRGQVAPDEIEGVRVGGLDISLRQHRYRLADWRARLAACLPPWPCGT